MRRSWIVEKQSDPGPIAIFYQCWYHARPVEGGGSWERAFSRSFLRNKAPYFVAYEGDNVPDSLCECRILQKRYGLVRFAHAYSWADAPWIEFVAWG